MDEKIVSAIIGGAATISAAIIGKNKISRMGSRRFRAHHDIPDILGTWKNEWFIGDSLYETDTFEIKEWVKNSSFGGKGYDSKGGYSFDGEVTASRSVVAIYRDTAFPRNCRVGTFAVQLSVDGKNMAGLWHGLTVEGNIQGGRVMCTRV